MAAAPHAFFTESFVLENVKMRDFSWILEQTIPRRELEEIARKTGVPPLGGVQFRKMADWELGDFVADIAYDEPKLLKSLCATVRERLPDPLLHGRKLSGPSVSVCIDLLANLPYEATLPLVVRLLSDPDPKVRSRVTDVVERSIELDEEEAKAREAEERRVGSEKPGAGTERSRAPDPLEEARARAAAASEKAAGLELNLAHEREEAERGRRQLDELRRKLGEANERLRRLEDDLQKESERRRDADRRAAEHKRQKEEALAPSEREEALSSEVEKLRRENAILLEKIEWSEEQVALASQEEEEGPPAAPKPAETREEEAAAQRVTAFSARMGRRPAFLVIGGARKQYSHKPKFEALKTRVGFDGDWEWADYDAWHRRMERLRHDMERRYDGLVILHWNRTTFTEKARAAAERAGRLHRTVQYRGFLSLRRALFELIAQIADREGEPAA